MKRIEILKATVLSPLVMLASRIPAPIVQNVQKSYDLVVAGMTDAGEYVSVRIGPIFGLPEQTDEEVMDYMGRSTWFEQGSFLYRTVDRFELSDENGILFQGPLTKGVIPRGWQSLEPAGRLLRKALP